MHTPGVIVLYAEDGVIHTHKGLLTNADLNGVWVRGTFTAPIWFGWSQITSVTVVG